MDLNFNLEQDLEKIAAIPMPARNQQMHNILESGPEERKAIRQIDAFSKKRKSRHGYYNKIDNGVIHATGVPSDRKALPMGARERFLNNQINATHKKSSAAQGFNNTINHGPINLGAGTGLPVRAGRFGEAKARPNYTRPSGDPINLGAGAGLPVRAGRMDKAKARPNYTKPSGDPIHLPGRKPGYGTGNKYSKSKMRTTNKFSKKAPRNLKALGLAGAAGLGVAGLGAAGYAAYKKKHKDNIDKAAYEILEYGLDKEAAFGLKGFADAAKANAFKQKFSKRNMAMEKLRQAQKGTINTVPITLPGRNPNYKSTNKFSKAKEQIPAFGKAEYKNIRQPKSNLKTLGVAGAGVAGAGALAGAGYATHKNKHKDDIDKAAFEILEYGLDKEAKLNFKKIREGVGKARTNIKEVATGKRIKDNYNTLKFLKKSDPEYQRYNKILKKELGKTVGLHAAGGVSAAGLAGAGAYAGYKKHKEK